MTRPGVERVSLRDRIVTLFSGEEIPITHMFDDQGDEADPRDCFRIVAGPMKDGNWLGCMVTAEERAALDSVH